MLGVRTPSPAGAMACPLCILPAQHQVCCSAGPTEVLKEGQVPAPWGRGMGTSAPAVLLCLLVILVLVVIVIQPRVHVVLLLVLCLPPPWPCRDTCKPPLPGHRGHTLGAQSCTPTQPLCTWHFLTNTTAVGQPLPTAVPITPQDGLSTLQKRKQAGRGQGPPKPAFWRGRLGLGCDVGDLGSPGQPLHLPLASHSSSAAPSLPPSPQYLAACTAAGPAA